MDFPLDKIFETKLIIDNYKAIPLKKLITSLRSRKLDLTKEEGDALRLAEQLHKIKAKISDIEAGLSFITFYPANRKIRKIYSRTDYIIYHLEFLHINIVGLFDRILHLINYKYALRLDPRDIILENILSSPKVDLEVKRLLRVIDKELQNGNIRVSSNIVKHRGKLNPKTTGHVGILEVVARNFPEKGIKIPPSYYKSITKSEIRKVNIVLKKFSDLLCDLFDYLAKH